ncbi:MAG: hypothetical protein FJZ01_02580 [Candidatus Sericytochromatia bacterium]|nr:hypothetical protein [Candidatus Tanganyikabacteria bacterium]
MRLCRTLPALAALLGPALLGGCDALANLLSGRIVSTLPTPVAITPRPTVPPEALRGQVLADLRRSDALPLFEARLINDGIGIFAGTGIAGATGARRWGRDYKATSVSLDEEASVFLGQSGRQALVVLRRSQPGTWLGDFPWRKALVRKGFQETLHREALFEGPGAWRLTEVSVAIQKPATWSVDILDVTLTTPAGSTTYATGDQPENRLMDLRRLAAGLPGEALHVAVRASSEKVAVFAYLGGTRRQALGPAGHDGRGWRFEGDVQFPDVPDLGQLGIDAIARSTLEDTNAGYDAVLWGVPVRRMGGAL